MDSKMDLAVNISNVIKPNLVLIDTSYLIYYRFYAIHKWYKLTYVEEFSKLPEDYNWLEDNIFMNKFNKLFHNNLNEFLKINKLTESLCIWAIDCPHSNIWRHKYTETYKSTRKDNHKKQKFHCHAIFSHVYNNIINKLPHNNFHTNVNNCEADDIIAQVAIQYQEQYNILIIASDTDYLQICNSNINLYKFPSILISNSNTMIGEKYLFSKIICGDISDNIPPCKIFKCSKLNVQKILEQPDKLHIINNIINKIKIKEQNLKLDEMFGTTSETLTLDDDISSVLVRTTNNNILLPELDFNGLAELEILFYTNMKLIDFQMIPQFLKTNIIHKFNKILQKISEQNKPLTIQ